MEINDKIYIPSDVKLQVIVEAPGFDMQQNDFDVTLVGKGHEETFTKQELYVENGDYFVCFHLSDFNPGPIKAITTAYIPDDAFSNSIRKSVTVNQLFLAREP